MLGTKPRMLGVQEATSSASQGATKAAASIEPSAKAALEGSSSSEAGAAPTLAQLNASLVMVPAKRIYHVKRKKVASAKTA